MDITKNSTLIKSMDDKNKTLEYFNALNDDLSKLFFFAQGRVRFGDGSDGEKGENISGEFQEFTSDAVADTEFSVTHGIGAVPRGAIIMWQDKAGTLYQGPSTGTSWTSTTVYFKCDVASVTFNVFLIK